MKYFTFLGLVILVFLLMYTTYREGYPPQASYIIPNDGMISDDVKNHIQSKHPYVMVTSGEINNKLDNMFKKGATPATVLYLNPSMTTSNRKDAFNKLKNIMDMEELIKNVIYVYSPKTGVYSEYFGRCSNMTLKNNSQGSNCPQETAKTT